MHSSSLRAALASAFKIPLQPTLTCFPQPLTNATRPLARPNALTRSPFSTSSPLAAKKKPIKADRRITLIRYHLHHPTTLMPRPLRFSRTRFLRHWTIHRAWNLHRHAVKKERQLDLERQYNAMNAACEELRVGAGDGGKLFRKAMIKAGVWSIPERGGGVPIEYARGMVDYVGGVAAGAGASNKEGVKVGRVWDSSWKRA